MPSFQDKYFDWESCSQKSNSFISPSKMTDDSLIEYEPQRVRFLEVVWQLIINYFKIILVMTYVHSI